MIVFWVQMADSYERIMAQDPVFCEFCKACNAEVVCQVCYDRVCNICEKVHQNIHSNTDSKPLPKVGKVQGFCSKHPRQRYEVCCSECRVPVCTNCILEVHNKHKMVNISVLYEEDKAGILEDISEMKTRIHPNLDIIAQHARAEKENIPSKCQMVANYLKIRVEKAKLLIDEIYEETIKELKEMEVGDVKAIDEHTCHIDEFMLKLHNTTTLFESQLKTRFESDLILFRRANPGISSCRTIPESFMYSPPIFKGGKADKSKLAKYLGELKPSSVKYCKIKKVRQTSKRSEARAILVSALGNILVIPPSSPSSAPQSSGPVSSNPPSRSTSLTKSAKSVKNFKRSYSVMTSVNCVSPEKAWISGQHPDIKLMDLESGECDSFSTSCQTDGPSDVVVTTDGDILFTDFDEKLVSRVSGKTKVLITTFSTDWNPKGLCSGMQDEVYVCQVENKYGKVTKFNKEGILLFEYVFDGDGNHIFLQPSYICNNEKSHTGIFVSDTLKHAVIGLDPCGNVRFEYKRNISDDRSPFDPRGLDIDVDGNIAVVDYGNHEVILLSDIGEFLICLLDRSDGLSRPCDISIDAEKKLWVAECRTGKLKVFQSFSTEMQD